MRWSKIKNIIIILLLLVNAFLLAQVGFRSYHSLRNERETRQRMVEVLERNDLAFLPQEIPGELELPPLRLTVTPPGRSEAEALVGTVTSVSAQGARATYTGELGTVVCSPTGEMDVTYTPGAVPVPQDIPALLASLGVETGELTDELSGDLLVTRCTQLYNGAPLSGVTARVYQRHGFLERITLRRLAGEAQTLPDSDAITASTALARFLDELSRGEGYVCSQVTRLYSGYSLSGAGTVTLTPCWFVDTDTWHFSVDGYTGAVTATE